jgi:acyl-CoA synthetase (AMP-forming)/AMP-acid ligase II
VIHRSPYPDVPIPDTTVSGYVLAGAEDRGDRPALVDGATGATVSYRRLAADVRAGAAGLAAAGIAPGDVVGLVTHNQPAFAVAFHAIASSGAAVTPMNPAATAGEMAAQFRAAGVRAVVAAEQAVRPAAEAADLAGGPDLLVLGTHPGLRSFGSVVEHGRSLIDAGAAPPAVADPGTALAAVPYSSGTGGAPKGVMLTHRNLVACVAQHRPIYRLTDRDVLVAVIPFFHIYGMSMILNCALHAGATLVTLPRFELRTYLATVERHRVTRGHFAPPLVLALATAPEVDEYDLSSLRLGICGAAPLDAEVAARATARIGCPIGQGYGMTEASPGTHFTADEEIGVLSAGCVGRLVPNTEARLVDPVTGTDPDPDGEGELWVRGPQVMAGYLRDPAATAATLVDGWLRTGDILRVDRDGVWWVVDRLKELIKYKGYQVAPAELEAVLLTHPAVLDAAVVGMPHTEGGEAPKAFVVLREDGEPPTGEEIMAWVAERVAPYKRVRAVQVVERIPKSPSGKILRRLLRAPR